MGDLINFDGGALPAHIRNMFGDAGNDDLSAGVSTGFPIISYKGKVWHVSEGGNRTLIADEDGDPKSSIEVVILKANPHISKVYYQGGYVEGSDEKPTCYSHDGKTPAADSLSMQAKACATCPRNQWGSRITESGAKGKECSDSRRLAVAPSGDLERAMLLRIPAASLKELVTYADTLNRRRVPYQAVVTKISFDHSVAYQKLTFKAVRFLDDAEVNTVKDVMDSATVQSIVGNDERPRTTPTAEIEDDLGPAPSNLSKLQAPKAKAAVTVDEVDAVLSEPEQEPGVAPVVTKPVKAAGGFGGEKAAPKVEAAPAPTPKAAKVLEEVSASLDEVLASLDD